MGQRYRAEGEAAEFESARSRPSLVPDESPAKSRLTPSMSSMCPVTTGVQGLVSSLPRGSRCELSRSTGQQRSPPPLFRNRASSGWPLSAAASPRPAEPSFLPSFSTTPHRRMSSTALRRLRLAGGRPLLRRALQTTAAPTRWVAGANASRGLHTSSSSLAPTPDLAAAASDVIRPFKPQRGLPAGLQLHSGASCRDRLDVSEPLSS
jgi:hypothetical protein